MGGMVLQYAQCTDSTVHVVSVFFLQCFVVRSSGLHSVCDLLLSIPYLLLLVVHNSTTSY